MKRLGLFIRRNPRTVSAAAFGAVRLAVQYFAWLPDNRMSRMAHVLTIGAGLVQACAGAAVLTLFAIVYTFYMFATDIHPAGPLSYVAMPFLVAVFAFLADGWALFLVSMGVEWALYRVAAGPQTA